MLAKQLRPRCNQQLEHNPKNAGNFPLSKKTPTSKPPLNHYQLPVCVLALNSGQVIAPIPRNSAEWDSNPCLRVFPDRNYYKQTAPTKFLQS